MKKIAIAILAFAALPLAIRAQEEKKEVLIEKKSDGDKKKKKETQEIIIRKTGDKNIKLKVEMDGDYITVNGKPLSEFKDKDVTINKKKITISDGDKIMSWNFNNNEQDWEKWGEAFGKNFEKSFEGHWEQDDNNESAFLGVSTDTDTEGAKITAVTKGSAAEKAGLEKGDIITKINEEPISSPEALSDVIGFKKPAEEVKVAYKRNGKSKTTTATLGKRKEARAYSFNNPQPRIFAFPSPGAPVAPNMEGMQDQLAEMQEHSFNFLPMGRKKLGLKIQDTEEENGVKVIAVEDSSAAAIAGLKHADVITEINGKKITNTDEAREELFPDEEKKLYKIKAKREGKEMDFEVKIPKKLKTANL